MNVATLTLGALATNCYLVWEEGCASALLIDAAGDAREIVGAARQRALEIGLLVNTHGHTDHTEALAALKDSTGAELAIHELDAPMLADAMLSGAAMWGFSHEETAADRLLREGDTIAVPASDIELSVLHTPGHTPGSICLLGEGALFSGDCLFAGGMGRVDLPGGDESKMMISLSRLAQLDPTLVVYPGHGPATTIGDEVRGNPWLAHR
ncbi:MAG: MBL fold metallo-hydrolase [Armatimonadota bacterium]|nr:MAG: MBL fold metallo-hydrolase [Armatimonadota bacterium]